MAKIFVMVGIAGSGKSTVAAELAEEHEAVINSSDTIREELYGNAAIQGNFKLVYQLMAERTKAALEAGQNVVYDATNVTVKRRRQLLDQLPQSVEKECVWVDVSLQCALQNNLQRKRHVPEWVIYRQAAQLEPPTLEEGWDNITTITY